MRVKRGEHEAALEFQGEVNGRPQRKTHRPVASSGKIPTCEIPGAGPPGIESCSARFRGWALRLIGYHLLQKIPYWPAAVWHASYQALIGEWHCDMLLECTAGVRSRRGRPTYLLTFLFDSGNPVSCLIFNRDLKKYQYNVILHNSYFPYYKLTSTSVDIWGRSCVVVRLLASYQGEPGSVPGEVTPEFWHVGIMPDDAAGRRVFSGISRFSCPFIPALTHTHLDSPSSALKTSMLRATQVSSLFTHYMDIYQDIQFDTSDYLFMEHLQKYLHNQTPPFTTNSREKVPTNALLCLARKQHAKQLFCHACQEGNRNSRQHLNAHVCTKERSINAVMYLRTQIPYHSTLAAIDQRLRDTGAVAKREHDSGRGRRVRTTVLEEEALASIGEAPSTSTGAIDHAVDDIQSTVIQVLREQQLRHFHLHKVQAAGWLAWCANALHGFGMMAPQKILARACKHTWIQHIVTAILVEVNSFSDLHVRLACVRVKSLVYEKPVESEDDLLARIVNAFDTIRYMAEVFGRDRLSLQRHCDLWLRFEGRAQLLRIRAAVAERLACSPPTKASRVQSQGLVTRGFSHVGIVPDDAAGRRVFSGISHFPPPFHSGAAPYSFRSPSSAVKTSLSDIHEDHEACHTEYLPSLPGRGGVVVILLASHQGDRVQSPAGSLRIYANVNRAGRCRWSAGFLGDLPFPPPLHSGAAPFSLHFTIIGSQDLVVKSHTTLSITLSTFILKHDAASRRPPSGRLNVSARCSPLEPFCLHCELVLDGVGNRRAHKHVVEKARVDPGGPPAGRIVSSCERLQGDVPRQLGDTPVSAAGLMRSFRSAVSSISQGWLAALKCQGRCDHEEPALLLLTQSPGERKVVGLGGVVYEVGAMAARGHLASEGMTRRRRGGPPGRGPLFGAQRCHCRGGPARRRRRDSRMVIMTPVGRLRSCGVRVLVLSRKILSE
ncbi:hypothetical protein PR048_013749 [Dryococelus australis]|uniref:CST complex subunit CTC1 n=1 Tax=Dryococelus australis TaxID=614101 RepID=A0ABQ9HT28_9NEOP|nr:hypothetical protein PR048_013749 [Dryococelus australis]